MCLWKGISDASSIPHDPLYSYLTPYLVKLTSLLQLNAFLLLCRFSLVPLQILTNQLNFSRFGYTLSQLPGGKETLQ